MQSPLTPRQRRTRIVSLAGALTLTVVLSSCTLFQGDEPDPQETTPIKKVETVEPTKETTQEVDSPDDSGGSPTSQAQNSGDEAGEVRRDVESSWLHQERFYATAPTHTSQASAVQASAPSTSRPHSPSAPASKPAPATASQKPAPKPPKPPATKEPANPVTPPPLIEDDDEPVVTPEVPFDPDLGGNHKGDHPDDGEKEPEDGGDTGDKGEPGDDNNTGGEGDPGEEENPVTPEEPFDPGLEEPGDGEDPVEEEPADEGPGETEDPSDGPTEPEQPGDESTPGEGEGTDPDEPSIPEVPGDGDDEDGGNGDDETPVDKPGDEGNEPEGPGNSGEDDSGNEPGTPGEDTEEPGTPGEDSDNPDDSEGDSDNQNTNPDAEESPVFANIHRPAGLQDEDVTDIRIKEFITEYNNIRAAAGFTPVPADRFLIGTGDWSVQVVEHAKGNRTHHDGAVANNEVASGLGMQTWYPEAEVEYVYDGGNAARGWWTSMGHHRVIHQIADTAAYIPSIEDPNTCIVYNQAYTFDGKIDSRAAVITCDGEYAEHTVNAADVDHSLREYVAPKPASTKITDRGLTPAEIVRNLNYDVSTSMMGETLTVSQFNKRQADWMRHVDDAHSNHAR